MVLKVVAGDKGRGKAVRFTAPTELLEYAETLAESEGWNNAAFHNYLWVNGLRAYIKDVALRRGIDPASVGSDVIKALLESTENDEIDG